MNGRPLTDICRYCMKPVLDGQATNGASGNHWDCHESAVKDLQAHQESMDQIRHVIQWYQSLGSSLKDATSRVMNEKRLIERRGKR